MLESVLAGVLNRFLAAYVDNLNTSQLNVGIWSGDVKLRNLKLKKDALDKFKLPVEVSEGFLGELTLSIPWSNLSGKPVKAVIDNVYLLAVPSDASESSAEEDEASAQARKMERLANAEILTAQPTDATSLEDEKKNESFMTSLVTKIVDNVQIEIKHIHIRYEDALSVPGHPFSAGITLNGFSVVSTDAAWKPTFITSSKGGIHKVAKLESLAVYFDTDADSLAGISATSSVEEAIRVFAGMIAREEDTSHTHQFILKPVSGEGRLTMQSVAPDTPRTDVLLVFRELGFVLDADQYRDVLSMVDLFHFYRRRRQYKAFRPAALDLAHVREARGAEPADARARTRALWSFALAAIASEVHERRHTWTWEFFRARRDDRLRYVELFKARARAPANAPPDEAAATEIAELERRLSFTDLRFYRSIARSQLRKERDASRDEPAAPAAPATGGGWFGWAWGSGPKADAPLDASLNEEQRQELYKAIDWDETEALKSAVDVPRETVLLRVQAQLQTGSFTLRRGAATAGAGTDIMQLTASGFALEIVQRPDNFDATLALDRMEVLDYTSSENVHTQIVTVKRGAYESEVEAEAEAATAEERGSASSGGSNLSSQSTSGIGSGPGLLSSPRGGKSRAVEALKALNSGGRAGSSDGGQAVSPTSSSMTTSPALGKLASAAPFFWLKFEHNPLDERADNALAMRLRHMEIIYSRFFVESIVAFFRPPASQLESVAALIDAANETLEGIRKETRAGLEYALAQHKTIDVLLDLNAPILVVPETMTRLDCAHLVVDAGHIVLKSELAPKGQHAAFSEHLDNNNTADIESLMYDKYHINLEATQLVMGPSLHACRAALESTHPGGTDMHVLERTSLSFLAQNCIVAQTQTLTRFKVSGALPSIQFNISDAKYKTFMRMIQVSIPQLGRSEDDAPPTPGPHESRHRPTFSQAHNDASIVVDSDDDDSVEFYDAHEHEDTPRQVQTAPQNAHQVIFDFAFTVEKVQASVFMSSPSGPERLLANARVEGFQLGFGYRPFDMSVDVLIRSLYVEDKMVDSASEFRHIVTSDDVGGDVGGARSVSRASPHVAAHKSPSHIASPTPPVHSLVKVKYRGVKKTSPEYETVHGKIDKAVDVELSTINVVITRASILTLFDWIMVTFTDGENAENAQTLPEAAAADSEPEAPQDERLRVGVKLTSIVFILNEDGTRLGTLALSAADVAVALENPTICVDATLGSLDFTDDTAAGQKLLSIEGSEVVDFKYQTYDRGRTDGSALSYPGYDSLVYLRSGSLQSTFLEAPVHRLLVFVSKFARMKSVYDAARDAAARRATEISERTSRMHYDIAVQTPILVFPLAANASSSRAGAAPPCGFRANLGEFTLFNEFAENGQTLLTASLSKIKLTSQLDRDRSLVLPVVDDIHLNVKALFGGPADVENGNPPSTTVTAHMSDVKMNLTQAQYGFIFQLLMSIPRAFSMSEDEIVDDTERISEIDSPSNPMTSSQKSSDEEARYPNDDMRYLSTTGNNTPVPPTPVDEDNTKQLGESSLLDAAASDMSTTSLSHKAAKLKLQFSIKSVYLELHPPEQPSLSSEQLNSAHVFLKNTSLVRFSLTDTDITYSSYRDETAASSITIKSFNIRDTRAFHPTKFADMIPVHQDADDKNQFTIDFAKYANGQSLLSIEIESPRIIFSLEPVFALVNYFTSPFLGQNKQEEAKADDDDDLPVIAQDNNPFSFRITITSPTVILLDNPEASSSEAIILSISKIQIIQQRTTALVLSRIGMFLCRMNKPNETLRVLDDFDIALSMSNRAERERIYTSIDLNIQALILRVSLRDILLINSIVSRAIEMSNKSSNAEENAEGNSTTAVEGTEKESHMMSFADTPQFNAARSKLSNVARRRTSTVTAVSKQVLRASFDGLQIILIGDENDLPVMHVRSGTFAAKVKNWSSDLVASASFTPLINYFNWRVSHWEPFMDPWELSFHVSKNMVTNALSLSLSSQKRLELNISSSFIDLVSMTLATIKGGLEGSGGVFDQERGANPPFLIRNRTGYPIVVMHGHDPSANTGKSAPASVNDLVDAGDASAQDTAVDTVEEQEEEEIVIMDGEDLPWRFDDWRKIRENINANTHNVLSVHFPEMPWNPLTRVNVDREGEKIYSLLPKLENITHHVTCDVELVEYIKHVTFRSSYVVQNCSLVNAELVIIDQNGKRASAVYKIPPGGECAVPILDAYHNRIRIRPDPGLGYLWSVESIQWQDLVKRPNRAIECRSTSDAIFRFQACAVQDKADYGSRSYPRLRLKLFAPIEVQNLLPFNIRYRIFDKNLERNRTSYLRKGGSVSPIHVADLSHMILLSVEIQDSVFSKSEFAIINTDNAEDIPVEDKIIIYDKDKNVLNLRINYLRHPDSGGSFRVQIYSPYIFYNKTGFDYELRTKTFMTSWKPAAGFSSLGAEERKATTPFVLSFPTEERSNRVLMRVTGSNWSEALSFETVGVESDLTLPSLEGNKEIHLGLKVSEGLGDYKLSKVVSIYPRFILKNNISDEDVYIKELNEPGNGSVVHPGNRRMLEYVKRGVAVQVVLRFATSRRWSAPFEIQNVGFTYVRIFRKEQEQLLRVEVVVEGPCLFVRFDMETGAWPYLLENESDYPISFRQVSEDPNRPNTPQIKGVAYFLVPKSTMPYAWDYPADPNKMIAIDVSGQKRLINVLEIGSQLPVRFNYSGRTQVLSIDVRADGPTQRIVFSNYREEDNVYKQVSAASSTSLALSPVSSNVNSGINTPTDDKHFKPVIKTRRENFVFGVSLEGMGISLINKRMEELVYASVRGITARYSDSSTDVSYDLVTKWIQIDNQLLGANFPILLYPAVIPKEGQDLNVHPSFQASCTVLKDNDHGVTYFKYASMLIQEMTIEVDEDFLFEVIDFIRSFSEDKTRSIQTPDEQMRITDEPDVIPEPEQSYGGGNLYFEVLDLKALQLDLSFMRTDKISADQRLNTRNPVIFFINALTMALGNVNDAPVQLNELLIENVRLSMPVLQERLIMHYSNEFYGQLYRVLGSADFLGNPMGLFSNVSSGVRDFFVTPYDSVMLNGNKELGAGLARGAGSFAQKTVFGLSDSLSKVTGSISKGLTAATLDKVYQDQRRRRRFRNKPAHALYGVTEGASSFVSSVASGFEGIVTKPLEGAELEGTTGFFKGFGKGLVGVVTKPVIGFFDMANNITEGIKSTTNMLDPNTITRVRLPRYIAYDNVLRPYQERESLGQSWLKTVEESRFLSEKYVAHLEIEKEEETNDTLVVILTLHRILLIRVLRMTVVWDVLLSDLKTISLESNGITLVLRRNVAGPFLSVPDPTNRVWLFKNMERVVTFYNAKKISD